MMQTQILVDGNWIDGVPTTQGQEYRKVITVGQATGYERLTYIPPAIETPLTPIIVTEVTGAIITNSTFTDITCYELTDIHVKGTLDVPDQMFRMPIRRSDGKETVFLVDVVNGQFDALLNFPISGEYEYTNVQANARFAEPLFKVEPISITVARKTGV